MERDHRGSEALPIRSIWLKSDQVDDLTRSDVRAHLDLALEFSKGVFRSSLGKE